jgi:tRNA (cytidine/uridine-2'-O-)-methyltransferase
MTTHPLSSGIRLALYQPDIPQNTGTLMRLCACLGVGLDVIEPCGFVLSDKNLRRAGMDYLDQLNWRRHADWAAFQARKSGRLIVLSTQASENYTDFIFQNTDTLLLGRESSGLPADIHDSADARIIIPMQSGMRSLNVAIAGAMVLGEALRQTRAPKTVSQR